MAIKYSSFGALLKVGDDNATAELFTTVPGVQDITGPEFTTEQIEVTAHDSPGGFREYVVGPKDTGEIGFTLVFDPADATHQKFFGNWADRQLHNYQLVFTDIQTPSGPTTMDFAGLVVSFSFSMAVIGAMSADCSIRVSGEPIFTPAWS